MKSVLMLSFIFGAAFFPACFEARAECELHLLPPRNRAVAEFKAAVERAQASKSERPMDYWSPILLDKARAVFDASGVEYKQVFRKNGVRALQIVPKKGREGLNFLSYGLLNRLDGVGLVYDPWELLNGRAGGYYVAADTLISMPHETIWLGPTDPNLAHELIHAVFHYRMKKSVFSLFHGWASSSSGAPLTTKMADEPLYREYSSFNELAAFSLELHRLGQEIDWRSPSGRKLASSQLRQLAYVAKYARDIAVQVLELLDEAAGKMDTSPVSLSRPGDHVLVRILLNDDRKLSVPLMGPRPVQIYEQWHSSDQPEGKAASETVLKIIAFARLRALHEATLRLLVVFESLSDLADFCETGNPTNRHIDALKKAAGDARQIILSYSN